MSGADHDDYAVEPIPGLPSVPPEGERILWQGAPDWRRLAWDAFYLKPIAAWFGVVAIWRTADGVAQGLPAMAVAERVLFLAPFAALAVAILALLAWLSARGTVYTITSKRVVMRFGLAFSIAFNLPFSRLDGADLRPRGRSFGDIALRLKPGQRLGYSHFWPHVRPWAINHPQPMLRALPDAASVAQTLARAVADSRPGEVVVSARPAAAPASAPLGRPVPAAG